MTIKTKHTLKMILAILTLVSAWASAGTISYHILTDKCTDALDCVVNVESK